MDGQSGESEEEEVTGEGIGSDDDPVYGQNVVKLGHQKHHQAAPASVCHSHGPRYDVSVT